MNGLQPLRRRARALGLRRALPRRIPLWASLAFSVGFAIALSPSLLYVYGIHNDYEMLILKNHGFFFHEAAHLFSIARPVAAILSNLTLLPAETIADFRWTRLFSVLTVCFMGVQIISICVHRLRVDMLPAVVIGLATFLVPAFIYSVLNAPAWATHLLPVVIALMAYEILSRSNVQALPFIGIVARRDQNGFLRQLRAYCGLRSVWGACFVLQLAFYDFPPNALVLAALPVVAILFSRAPWSYRLFIGLRDIGFLVVNLGLYVVSAKLLYIPFIRLLIFRNSEAWRNSHLSKFEERIASSYNYKFNTDPSAMMLRVREIAKVSGDLWFMPQARIHLLVGICLVLALIVGAAWWRRAAPSRRPTPLQVAAMFVIPIACFLLSASAVLGSDGGFVSYRTIPICTVIVAIVFIYSVRSIAGAVGDAVGRSPATGVVLTRTVLVLVAAAAVAGNFEMNYLTMKLARNETAYFNDIVRQAIENHSTAVLIVDPRPFSLPEDHPVAYDQHGRAIPPYELSCFSGVCLQDGAIVKILAEEQGVSRDDLQVYSMRGDDPVPDATCRLFTDSTFPIPPSLSEDAVNEIKFLRTLRPVTCVMYSLAWHDLG